MRDETDPRFVVAPVTQAVQKSRIRRARIVADHRCDLGSGAAIRTQPRRAELIPFVQLRGGPHFIRLYQKWQHADYFIDLHHEWPGTRLAFDLGPVERKWRFQPRGMVRCRSHGKLLSTASGRFLAVRSALPSVP